MSDRRRPNILWLCTDQQRWDTLGCYDNDHVSTPNLDDLASTGVRFDRCFSQSPVCSPSRDSFLTGRYPRTTGVRQNGQQIQPGETLVTRTLSEAGYTCGLAGKLHLGPVNPGRPEPPKMAERRIEDGYADFPSSVILLPRHVRNSSTIFGLALDLTRETNQPLLASIRSKSQKS